MLTNKPRTSDIVAEIALSNGHLPLAAERLHLTSVEILTLLSQDPSALDLLTKHLKVTVLLSTFKNLQAMSEIVMEQTETSEYSDDIKAMTAYSNLFAELTKGSASIQTTTNVNVFERTMAMLPKEVRDSVMALAANGNAEGDNVIEIPKGRPRRLPKGTDDD